VKTARGTLVAYATEPGSVAEDGDGSNGVYTAALLEALGEPGLNEDRLFKKVGALVEARTGGKQRPWREGSLRGDFIFGRRPNAPVTVTVEQAVVQPAPARAARETVFWQSIEDRGSAALFEDYLRRFPNGTYVTIAHVLLDKLKTAPVVASVRPPAPPVVKQAPTPPGATLGRVE
jgi:hypothetical protein